MRKGRDGGGKGGGEWKIIAFKVATNVVASRPPERQPTGIPPARANWHLPVVGYAGCPAKLFTLFILLFLQEF